MAKGKERTVGIALSGLPHSSAKGPYARDLKSLGNTKVIGKRSDEISNISHRSHSGPVKKRFSVYHTLRDYNINSSIFSLGHDISNGIDRTSNERKARSILASAKHIQTGRKLSQARQENLLSLICELATKKHSQRALKLGEPSPTVLSIPDDVVHPTEPRTLTVREQARLQSFPDNFQFRSKVTTGGKSRKSEVPQYTQVGNAVPPLLARHIGLLIKSLIK